MSKGGNWHSVTSEQRSRYKLNVRQWVEGVRESEPCLICGEMDPVVKEFHHIRPEDKRFNIGNCWRSYSLTTVKIEMDKCVVLCANCHKRVTAGVITVEMNEQGVVTWK